MSDDLKTEIMDFSHDPEVGLAFAEYMIAWSSMELQLATVLSSIKPISVDDAWDLYAKKYQFDAKIDLFNHQYIESAEPHTYRQETILECLSELKDLYENIRNVLVHGTWLKQLKGLDTSVFYHRKSLSLDVTAPVLRSHIADLHRIRARIEREVTNNVRLFGRPEET